MKFPNVFNIKIVLTFFVFVVCHSLLSQSGIIKGVVIDAQTNEAISFADIFVINQQDSTISSGTFTDDNGFFIIENLEPGFYKMEVNILSYEQYVLSEIRVVNNKPAIQDVSLNSSSVSVDEVVIRSNPFKRTKESPLSKRTLGVTEIRRSPGAAQDISKVFKILPGVTAPPVTFRNDLFIRGGGPNENSFYLDGVQVPVINHFTTQGSSGGPAGMINTEFIDNVDFLSSAFPANRSNALSSVIDFSFREGRNDRIGGTFNLGSTNAGLTLEGPIGEKTTFLVSARRSYLQLLFSLIDLPFLPSYWDFQAKVSHQINKNNKITFIGLGAIDDLALNQEAYNSEQNAATLERIPELNQWNYTNGIVYDYFRENGLWKFIVSRTMLNNSSIKYENNDASNQDNLIFDYNSREIYNNSRAERIFYSGNMKVTAGIRYQYIKYSNNSTIRIFDGSGGAVLTPSSALNFHTYATYAQLSKSFLEDKLSASFGLNLEGNSYSDEFANPLKHISPRLALSYNITDNTAINASLGRYFQTPPLTILGYESNGTYINKENNISSVIADHYVIGMSFLTNWESKVSVEGYLKLYQRYPFLTRDSVNLANLGGDFGVVGNEPAISIGEGKTYGMEVLYQQKLYKNLYGSVSYTLGFSEFSDANGNFIPSNWDTRHILNVSAGIRLKNDWEISASYRYQSAQPRTPYDPASSLVQSWQINNGEIPDYNLLNSERGDDNNLVNLRIDKKWFFEKWNLNVYLDIENLLADAIAQQALILDRPLNSDGIPSGDPIIINPDAPRSEQRYKTKVLTTDTGILVPTLGIMIEI